MFALHLLQETSPYEIFVRDLVAVDGATDTELLLIDDRGCPADTSIMGPLNKSRQSNKTLISDFDAFRFPTSDVVQFRAMVTPCMPTCEPVICDVTDYTGQTRQVGSYGKRKKRDLSRQRRMTAQPEEMLVIKTLKIVDKIGRRRGQQQQHEQIEAELPRRAELDNLGGNGHSSVRGGELTISDDRDGLFREFDVSSGDFGGERCMDQTSLIAGAIIFIVAQVRGCLHYAMR